MEAGLNHTKSCEYHKCSGHSGATCAVCACNVPCDMNEGPDGLVFKCECPCGRCEGQDLHYDEHEGQVLDEIAKRGIKSRDEVDAEDFSRTLHMPASAVKHIIKYLNWDELAK